MMYDDVKMMFIFELAHDSLGARTCRGGIV